MKDFGTPRTTDALKLMLLGSGELGKEVAIEAQRLGIHVIAVDRYANAPAMQLAHESHVIDMLDGEALKNLIALCKPDYVVPEVEAIATDMLVSLENDGLHVVPTARATQLTMDREGIRRLAAEDLNIPTSPFKFAGDAAACRAAIEEIGTPCIVKPVMSSSGKGQITVRSQSAADEAWDYAVAGGRAGKNRVIVEGFVDFDYEITLLTVRHRDGVSFCAPIGHTQIDGDYRESWQPQPMSPQASTRAQDIAARITESLGGTGLFGVELFVRGDEVLFSEVSPRPHDTGMVTLISQDLSEFALHVRAITGMHIPDIRAYGPAASAAMLGEGHGESIVYAGVREACIERDTNIRIFGKPSINGKRRLGVGLALGEDINEARAKARRVIEKIRCEVG
ncbi:MAG: formate-dependent phosphoribosylglycinamide formyltransferase [Gammaproteobacteria bacterium]